VGEFPEGDFFQLNVCDTAVAATQPPNSSLVDSAALAKTKERVVNPPLGWVLSRLAREWMDASLGVKRIDAKGADVVQSAGASICRADNSKKLDAITRLMAKPITSPRSIASH
jgi:hypothetical protein